MFGVLILIRSLHCLLDMAGNFVNRCRQPSDVIVYKLSKKKSKKTSDLYKS